MVRLTDIVAAGLADEHGMGSTLYHGVKEIAFIDGNDDALVLLNAAVERNGRFYAPAKPRVLITEVYYVDKYGTWGSHGQDVKLFELAWEEDAVFDENGDLDDATYRPKPGGAVCSHTRPDAALYTRNGLRIGDDAVYAIVDITLIRPT